MRTMQGCVKCGDEREIVAHGLCARCYMADRRDAERLGIAVPERSQRWGIKERDKEYKTLVGIVKLVHEAECLSQDEMAAILGIIQPHLVRHALALGSAVVAQEVNAVNSNSAVNVDPEPDVDAEETIRFPLATPDAEPQEGL